MIELRARREALGLSQPQLADLLGVTQATISRWEKGERSPENWPGIHVLLCEWEDLAMQVEDEAVEAVEHASAVQDSPAIEVRTYATDEAWWAMDARAKKARAPAVLHRVAVARAAAGVRDELGISVVFVAK